MKPVSLFVTPIPSTIVPIRKILTEIDRSFYVEGYIIIPSRYD